MSTVAITDYFEKPGAEELEILGDLVGTETGADTKVLLVWHEVINEAYLQKTPNLIGIQRYGVGYDTIDLACLKQKGIMFCNNPDYGTDEVSDTAVSMVLGIARGVYHYNYLAKSYFSTWQENVIKPLKRNNQTTVGVIGAGRIGGSVVLKCNALKFNTVFYDPYKERGYEKMINSRRVESLEELLRVSDIVSIHTPLNAETRGMIDQHFIDCMKEGASIVNTARGGLFADLDVLYAALKDNKLFSLATDVLEVEPPVSCKLIDAWRDKNSDLQGQVIINPHTSYYSQSSIREMRIKAAQNALRMVNGEMPFNLIAD